MFKFASNLTFRPSDQTMQASLLMLVAKNFMLQKGSHIRLPVSIVLNKMLVSRGGTDMYLKWPDACIFRLACNYLSGESAFLQQCTSSIVCQLQHWKTKHHMKLFLRSQLIMTKSKFLGAWRLQLPSKYW